MVVRDSCAEPAACAARGRLPAAAEPPVAVEHATALRDDVRDGVYVMAFSLLASTGTALTLVLLTKLAG